MFIETFQGKVGQSETKNGARGEMSDCDSANDWLIVPKIVKFFF